MKKEKILWGLFLLNVTVLSVDILTGFLKQNIYSYIISFLVLSLPVILLILHSFWTLGMKRGIAFFLISALTGLVFEIIGLKIGVVFGGHYVYSPSKLMIVNVPISVPIYWAVFIYTGYTIVNSFLLWLDKNKPSRHKDSLIKLLKLVILDGLIVVAIDLFMDPLMVKAGKWTWLEGGTYFGIPIGNFIGWFMVVVISTGIFRLYEFFNPRQIKKINENVFLIPVFGYGLMAISFVVLGINYQMYNLLLIGSLLMFPVPLSNLFLYSKSKFTK